MCYSFACYCKDKVILEISLWFVGYENIIYVLNSSLDYVSLTLPLQFRYLIF